MANSIIAQSVNRSNTAQALAQARAECAGDTRWLNAVNRAALNLEACPWQFDGETLVIQSATSDKRYTVTPEGCACKAFADGRPCWHRAAVRLIQHVDKERRETQRLAERERRRTRSLAQVQAAADELF